MPRFHLHRIQRMIDNPRAEDITPGLEAAMYLHWITLYEHDPKRFAALEPKLPELRKHLADYVAHARDVDGGREGTDRLFRAGVGIPACGVRGHAAEDREAAVVRHSYGSELPV